MHKQRRKQSVAGRLSMIAALIVSSGSGCLVFASRGYAEQHVVATASAVSTVHVHETPRAVQYHADHYRDPFVPKPVARDASLPSTPQATLPQAAMPQEDDDVLRVRVKGIVSAPHGQWALLEFENGERLIVTTGQVLSAYARVVKRITEQGVTLAALDGMANDQSPSDRTYRMDE